MTEPAVLVACSLPEVARTPFSARFPIRFNDTGRVLAPAELLAGQTTEARVAVD